ncbi:hypothetical protein LY28_00993 [Ruminiclostridium sufflavum DSM 19573]|uniref:Uncharacterized protein n=1 Tax=Ruminiclostridium sufflavum DSM 19573 TaxID=1121337 RepID=A0A318XPR1_9FIRM|nr:hypothetical protein LY28_00993 [Ruminiclostridium sufflavum DSM 19573]
MAKFFLSMREYVEAVKGCITRAYPSSFLREHSVLEIMNYILKKNIYNVIDIGNLE